ncbi:MAG: sulfite exporter TauE/SafE family protein [Candidatus Saccharibacteria bacterium]|nr:sulfite exporter TauE/SafE family protein [Pseudorhodobacter sp.]
MAFACLIAAFVRGYSGFGFSALVVSASALVMDPLHVVGVVMICEFVMTFQQWRGVRADVDWRRVAALMIGAVVGLPIGLWGITRVGVDTARAVIAIYVLVMCVVMLRGWQIRSRQGFAPHLGVGVFAGMANAVGMAGLPVASYFTAQGMAAGVFRGTLIAYFAALDLFSIPVMWGSGIIQWDTLRMAVGALPLMFIGVWAGGRHFLATDPQDFRRFAIGLLAFLAVINLIKVVV